MKLTQLLLSTAALIIPAWAQAAAQNNNDRWFEVEVILFSQLGDKNQLKEQFPEQVTLPKYQKVEDLLSKYLNPDIASLKQLLPNCDTEQASTDLVTEHAKLPTLFSEKSLAEIAQLAPSSFSATDTKDEFSDNTASFNNKNSASTLTPQQDINATVDEADLVSDTLNVLSAAEQAQQQALVLAAEQAFTTLTFQYNDNISDKSFCKIDEKYFADVKANDPYFNYNGFDIAKVPLRIHAEENLNNNSTHLLGKASLKLGDVIQDLRYSKNFRPMLHMGWRQVARPKKQSVPVRMFAGDNFALDYKKQLTQYQKTQPNVSVELVNKFEGEMHQQIVGEQVAENHVINSETLALEQLKQARIAEIVAQISSVPEDADFLLERLQPDDLTLNTAEQATPRTAAAPVPPLQEWLIDGMFNIHLKHYLFITADFSILDKNLSELATAKLAATPLQGSEHVDKNTLAPQAKAIRFQQNRRVISGEVHYFDHPYMGMIVQIRPYKKPKPEQVNQF
ncbi:MAG: CsiV family protein [Cognaticolwellia sp.]